MSNRIHLALSGGGLRAAYFHLGTLLALADLNKLNNLTTISSVSGGSILLAFYIKSIADNKGASQFEILDKTEQLLTTYASRGPRSAFFPTKGLSYTTSQIEILKTILGQDTTVGLLQQYTNIDLIFSTTSYGDLNGEPAVAPLSVRHGHGDTNLASAVAASAALPFVFRPLRLESNGESAFYVDGGVLDNLGVESLTGCSGIIISSDASAPACLKGSNGELRVRPALVANDVALDAIRSRQLADLKKEKGTDFKHISLRKANKYEISPEFADALPATRTDLDSFSQSERYSLIAIGYLTAFSELSENDYEIGCKDRILSGSTPFGKTSSLFRKNIFQCLNLMASKNEPTEPTRPISRFLASTATFLALYFAPYWFPTVRSVLAGHTGNAGFIQLTYEYSNSGYLFGVVFFWLWQCVTLTRAAYDDEQLAILARINLLTNIRRGENRFLRDVRSGAIEDGFKWLFGHSAALLASLIITTFLCVLLFSSIGGIGNIWEWTIFLAVLLVFWQFIGRQMLSQGDLVSTLPYQRSITLMVGSVVSDIISGKIFSSRHDSLAGKASVL